MASRIAAGLSLGLFVLLPLPRALGRPAPAGDTLQHAWKILAGGREVGKALLKTDRAGQAVVMEDRYELEQAGERLVFKIRQECDGAASLTPRTLLLEESRGKAVRAFEALFNKGLMTVVEGEEAVTSAISPRPVTWLALFRLLPAQAQKEGAAFAFDFLDVNGFVCKPRQKLVCAGAGGKGKPWRWTPAEKELGPLEFWIEGDRVTRAVIGPYEWVFIQ